MSVRRNRWKFFRSAGCSNPFLTPSPIEKVSIRNPQEVAGGEVLQLFPMAEKPTAGEAKVVKDALPASGSKQGGNPAFRMMGESIQSLRVMLERRELVLVTD